MPKVKYSQGVDGLWYWRVVAKNGRIVVIGGEGYSTKSNARKAFHRATYIARYEAKEERD